MFKTLLLAAVASIATSAQAANVIDQNQPDGNAGLAGFSNLSHPLQSFQTNAGNVSGGGFRVHGVSGTDPLELQIALWDALPNAVGANQLASGTVEVDPVVEQWADVFWTPVTVATMTTYYLTVDIAGGTVGGGVVGVFRGNPYPNGELFLRDAGSGGQYQTYSSDTTFRTYTFVENTGAIPEPATWALLIGGFGLAGGMLRRVRSVPVRS